MTSAAAGPNRLRAIGRAFFAIVLVAAALTARVMYGGEREIRASTESLEAGNAEEAIARAREAALWYAPGAPHVRVAYGRLMAIGREAEQRKLWATSLLAYRAVVSASTSTRWLGTPHSPEVEQAKQAIARIEAKTAVRAPLASTEPAEVMERAQLAALAEETRPRPVWRLVIAGSFIGLLLGIAMFLRVGMDETGRVSPGRAAMSGAVCALGLAGYGLALFLA